MCKQLLWRRCHRIMCKILLGSPSDFFPKLRDKIRNEEPGFKARQTDTKWHIAKALQFARFKEKTKTAQQYKGSTSEVYRKDFGVSLASFSGSTLYKLCIGSESTVHWQSTTLCSTKVFRATNTDFHKWQNSRFLCLSWIPHPEMRW